MKKIAILTAVALGSLLVFSSCDLDIDPDTAIKGDDAYTFEYVEGERAGVYSGLKSITSGAYLYDADYQTDLFNETAMSGNRGGFFHRWNLYPSDQDVSAIWSGYYGMINRINYTLRAIEVVAAKEELSGNLAQLALFRAEMCLLRAYTVHQAVLRFCEDYDPARATQQLGVPYPTEFDPDAQLPRETLAVTYKKINEDIKSAETQLNKVAGESDYIYLSADAVTAFKAQVALQMHEYANASNYASSLYAKYPLAQSQNDLERMWREDASSETIFQPEVVPASLGSVGSMTDYYAGTWNAGMGVYNCAPGYVLENWVKELYVSDDLRRNIYVAESNVFYNGKTFVGFLMTKFLGNKMFQTDKTVYVYKNMPKIFRIADMYLIDAEAKYRSNGDALTPLNTLRESRGLSALESVTGNALFTEIKNERVRETLGEGHRLTDLKRWNEGISRDYQTSLQNVLRGYLFTLPASAYMFVWPIPQLEMSNNPNIGSQNPGYLQ